MTTALFFAGVVPHVILNATVVFEAATPTANPIWRELRLIPSVLATAAVWLVFWWVTQ